MVFLREMSNHVLKSVLLIINICLYCNSLSIRNDAGYKRDSSWLDYDLIGKRSNKLILVVIQSKLEIHLCSNSNEMLNFTEGENGESEHECMVDDDCNDNGYYSKCGCVLDICNICIIPGEDDYDRELAEGDL